MDELFGLIRIPSISSIADHKPDMLKAAEYWKETILNAGADKAVVMPSDGNPVVYGEKIIDPALPTVLVYAHYDVMPVDRWTYGKVLHLNPKSGTVKYMPGVLTTTRDRVLCMQRLSKHW